GAATRAVRAMGRALRGMGRRGMVWKERTYRRVRQGRQGARIGWELRVIFLAPHHPRNPMRRLALLALLLPALAQAQPAFDPDTVRAGRLDGGKMWLFEDPPYDYLEATYGFTPDAEWFEHARLASLRMPGCS